MTEFSQFPDDVFLAVADYLTETSDIYTLAQTSRHHYYLFVPLYYKRNDLPKTPLGEAFLSGRKLSVLSILPTAPCVPMIRQLTVELSYPTEMLSVHLKRLKKALPRLTDLFELRVSFRSEDWYGGATHEAANYDSAWKAEFRNAFKEMVEMAWSTVKVVTIEKGQYVSILMDEEGRTESRKAALGPVGMILPGKGIGKWSLGGLSFKRKKDTKEVKEQNEKGVIDTALQSESEVKAGSSLVKSPPQSPDSIGDSIARGPPIDNTGSRTKVFYLHTPILFSEPLRPWLSSFLSSSPSSSLTHLSIKDPKVDSKSWSKLLPSLALPPFLHTLILLRTSIPILALTKFLNRHATVHTLQLGRTSVITYDEQGDKVGFKHVKTLITTPEQMPFFLQPGWEYDSLEEVVFECEVGHGEKLHFSALDINLDIEQQDAAGTAIASGTETGTANGTGDALRLRSSYAVALYLHSESPLVDSSWLGAPHPLPPKSSSTDAKPSHIHTLLSHVTKISLSWWKFVHERDIPAIVGWFALFPKLRRVEFLEDVRGVPGVKGVVEKREVVWRKMLEAVREARPEVEVVEN